MYSKSDFCLDFNLYKKIGVVILKGWICVEKYLKYPLELNLATPPTSWGQGCSLWKMYESKEGAYIFLEVG